MVFYHECSIYATFKSLIMLSIGLVYVMIILIIHPAGLHALQPLSLQQLLYKERLFSTFVAHSFL